MSRTSASLDTSNKEHERHAAAAWDGSRDEAHNGSPGAYPTTVIQPTRGWAKLGLRELWRYRELIYFLTWRDVKVRYKQTAIGTAWAVVQPLTNMLIFTVVFGRIAHLPSDGVPYQVFTLTALLPWTYFAYVLQQGGSSLVTNANMVSKVYFPRLALPTAAALAGLMDFLITFVLLLVMMLWYHIHPGLQVIYLPAFLLLAMAASLAVCIWLAALSAEYRDVKYLLPFLVQVWLFASPVAYSGHLVSGKMSIVYALNPMVGVIDGFRWCLLGVGGPPTLAILPSIAVTAVLLVGGLFYFRRMEYTFADVI